MAQFDSNARQFQEMFNTFNNMSSPIDRESVLAAHRKNLEALTEANKMAVEVMKSVSQLQSQFIKQSFQDMNSMLLNQKETPNPAKFNMNRQSQKVKEQVNKAIDHGNTIANLVSNSSKKVYSTLQERAKENMGEVKKTVKKASQPKKKQQAKKR